MSPAINTSVDADAVMPRLSATNDEDDRERAMRTISEYMDSMSTKQLTQALSSLEDIFQDGSSLHVRLLGLRILSKALLHPQISKEKRLVLLELATRPVQSEGLSRQLQTLNEIMIQSKPLTESEAQLIMRHLTERIAVHFQADRSTKERHRGNIKEDYHSTARETIPDEEEFNELLITLSEIIKLPSLSVPDAQMDEVLDHVLCVIENVSVLGTLESFCHLARTIFGALRVPSGILGRFIEDLCAICTTSSRLQDLAHDTLQAIIQSQPYNGVQIGELILRAIWSPPPGRAGSTSRGAIQITMSMTLLDTYRQLLGFRFLDVTGSLSRADLSSRIICKESLRALDAILSSKSLTEFIISENEWSPMFHILDAASGLLSSPDQGVKRVRDEVSSRLQHGSEGDLLKSMHQVIFSLASKCSLARHAQRLLFVQFLYRAEGMLPVGYVIDFMNRLERELSQEVHDTSSQLSFIEYFMDYFYFPKDAGQDVKTNAVNSLYKLSKDAKSEQEVILILRLVEQMLETAQKDQYLTVSNALSELSMMCGGLPVCTVELLQGLIDSLWPLLSISEEPETQTILQRNAGTPSFTQNLVTKSIAQTFVNLIGFDQRKSVLLFGCLIKIVQSSELPSTPRLQALKTLCRLRCDQKHRILLVATPDLQDLPAHLFGSASQHGVQSTNADINRTEKSDTTAARIGSGVGNGKMPVNLIRSHLRPSARSERSPRPKLPLWLPEGDFTCSATSPQMTNEQSRVSLSATDKGRAIHMGNWLVAAIGILQQPTTEWDIYSYVIVHLPAQLSNCGLFAGSMPHVSMLRRIIVDQILEGNVYEPPLQTGVRKGDVALCLYHSLTMLIGYTDNIEKKEQERIVHAFFHGIGQWERTAKFCIQTLAICCHVLPAAVIPRLSAILQKMSQVITQTSLTIDILEFLAGLARLPNLYRNFREEEFRTVFAICVKYLEYSREQRTRLLTEGDIARANKLFATESTNNTSSSGKPDVYKDIPQYVFALAYQVITSWFLSVKIGSRNDYVGWITRNLSWIDEAGNEIMEEQSQVTLDMMMRTTYLDLGETEPGCLFSQTDGPVLSKTWLLGLSIVTIETATSTGISRLTKRQASGTTFASYRPQTRELPPHHEPLFEDGQGADPGIHIFPNHVLLQLTSSVAPIPAPMEAICLPEDDFVKRAISVFDRYDTVDGYKVGVVFVANNQTDESSILANKSGSQAFRSFLDGLGTKVILRDATFNTQGLDRSDDVDGTHTYAWRDRITEVIFQVSTMMPTDLENDPQSVNKKRHIGNCYVTIVWNESGHPFRMDTLPSQFNCVTITIVPDSLHVPKHAIEVHDTLQASGFSNRSFYNVQMVSAKGFPDLSPVATGKLLPFKALPLLVRQLALQASVFSNVWVNRDTGEHASSWRNRLREIKRMRERYANTGTSTSSKFPGAKSSKSYTQGDSFHGRVSMGGLAEYGENLAASLDFSRWAGPNASFSGP